jgi:hypothetical protein
MKPTCWESEVTARQTTNQLGAHRAANATPPGPQISFVFPEEFAGQGFADSVECTKYSHHEGDASIE